MWVWVATIVYLSCCRAAELRVRFVETKSFGKSGTVEVRVDGGFQPYKYEWDFSQRGVKRVVVRDAAGNKAEADSSRVDLGVYVVSTNITCHGQGVGEVRADVVGGVVPYTYEWSNGRSDRLLSNLGAGEFCVVVRDSSGRQGQSCGNVFEPKPLVALAEVKHVSCYGAWDGIVNLTVVGGVAPYSFSWSGGGAKTEDILCTKGEYRVSVTDANGCVVVVEGIQVRQPPKLRGDVLILEEKKLLRAIAVGGVPPYTFSWDSGEQNASSSYNGSSVPRKLGITDANNCETRLTVMIPPAVELHEKKWTDLHDACANGVTDRVERLLEDPRTNIDAQSADNSTPLLVAVEHNHLDIVRVLLEKGAKIYLGRK